MNPDIIYRVQDASGRGPWKPGFSHKWVEDRNSKEYEALVPWTVEFPNALSRRIIGMHMGCGCRTIEQLHRWFTAKEYVTLQKFGYGAVKMEIGRILGESDIQCVFERAKPFNELVEPIELYPK